MANVEKLEDKVLDIINAKDSIAIALTGEWGIGKTYFWNNFYEKNHTNFKIKKYAYVSLFGIESLESLKFEIALKSHSTSQKKDNFSFIKKSFQKSLDVIDFSKIEGKGIALSLSKGMISSAVSSMITDTVICIDDIERHSAKLDIKDVMGLVNHLSLEKNCKVVVILHEGKADEDFREYKEKVFDEVLVLDDSLSIIEDLINDIETFPIYEKFYQNMGVRNLRLYQRVQKIYHDIIKHSSDLSKLNKEEILRQILIIKLVNDIPKVLDVDMKELETYFSEDGLDDRLDIFLKSDDEALKATVRTKRDGVEKKLSKFYPNFRMEGWTEVVVELITNIDINSEKFKQLLDKDLMNEQALKSDRLRHQLFDEYHSLEPRINFPKRFYEMASERISKDNLNSLSFYCDILRDYGEKDLESKLIDKIENYILSEVIRENGKRTLNDWRFSTADPNYRFHEFLNKTITENDSQADKSESYSNIFLERYKFGGLVDNVKDAFKSLDKDMLEKIIWMKIEGEQDYRKKFIISIITYPQLDNIDEEKIRVWIVELLNDRAIKNKMSRAPIKGWLAHTKDLTERLY